MREYRLKSECFFNNSNILHEAEQTNAELRNMDVSMKARRRWCKQVLPQAVDFLGVTSAFRHEIRKLFRNPDGVQYLSLQSEDLLQEHIYNSLPCPSSQEKT